MNRISRKFTIVALFVLLGVVAVMADEFDTIAASIRVGDAHGVALYFDKNVDVKTEDKPVTYSKNQAELVLREFFRRNVPRAFTIIHRGSSAKGAKYIIGNLETNQGNFRSFVYIKEVSQKQFIQEISFEKQ